MFLILQVVRIMTLFLHRTVMYLLKNELYNYFSADKVSEVVEYDLSLAEMSSNHCELYYL